MTVAALPAVVEYEEDGVSTSFPVPYRFRASTDLVVERVLPDGQVIVLAIGSDYAVTGGMTDAGGTLNRTVATNGAILRIRRDTARSQAMRYPTGGRFPAESHEEALDRQMLISQEQDAAQQDTSSRALMVPPGQVVGDIVIAPNTALTFDGSGQPVAKPIGSFPPGPTGPADNTYFSYAAMQASDPTRAKANLVGDIDVPPHPDGPYNNPSQTIGGWIPQIADGIASRAAPTANRQTVQLRLDQLDTLPAAAFGVTAGTTDDQAPALNAAMAVGMAQRKRVILPPGVITIGSPITVGSYFVLASPGRGETRLVLKSGFLGPMFNRKPAVITNVDIDVDARGNGVPGEVGFYMDSSARPVAPFDGGLWYARIAGRYDNFGGKALWFQGGAIALNGNPQSNVFHQFINLDDLSVNRFVDDSLGVVLTGLCGQFSFGARTEINGRADGGRHPTGWNIVASREFTQSSTGNAGCAADALNLDGTPKDGWGLTASGLGSGTDTNCYAVQFHSTASIQFSKGGMWVDRGTVQCDNVYCEGLFRAFHVTGSGTLEVRNSYGGNIAYNFESPTDTTGSAFSQATGLITGGSNAWAGYFMGSYHVQIGSGICDVKPDRFAIMTNTGAPRMPADLPSKTSMLLGVTNNRLNIQTYTDVFVGLDTNSLLTTIDTTLGVGVVITLRGFLNGTLRIGAGGNITSGAIEAGQVLILRPQDCVTLRRVDTFGTFVVTGASIAPLVGTSMPSSGYYYAGEFVRNTGALGTGPVTLGWQRLTTGNSHTAGTDWRVVQATGA